MGTLTDGRPRYHISTGDEHPEKIHSPGRLFNICFGAPFCFVQRVYPLNAWRIKIADIAAGVRLHSNEVRGIMSKSSILKIPSHQLVTNMWHSSLLKVGFPQKNLISDFFVVRSLHEKCSTRVPSSSVLNAPRNKNQRKIFLSYFKFNSTQALVQKRQQLHLCLYLCLCGLHGARVLLLSSFIAFEGRNS